MILTVKFREDTDCALFPLIERLTPIYLPVKKVPANSYYNGYALAADFGYTPDDFLEKIALSTKIHAIVLPTGAFYVHPHGVDNMLTRRAKRLIVKHMKLRYNQ